MSFLRIYDHLKIQMEDIISATNNFDSDKLIGCGGFGPVYKGELSLPEGPIMVAFKKLDRRLGQGKTEFWREVMILSKYKHENLISLMHYCIEGDEMILGYEYASRGSLNCYLNDANLTWTRRLKICVGAARGLNYLHDPNEGQQSVIHRDIKSGNILLDKKWMAKVSDFGLSKFGPAQSVFVSNGVGTIGYIDPVYLEMGFLSKESDVYSFGVVLFEVLCGRLCYEYNNGVLTNIFVSKWRKCYEKKTLDEIIFSGLKEQMDPSSLNAFSAIAYRCVKRDREERPTMAEVVKELEFALQVSKEYEPLRIQMKDILSATNNFDSAKLIGRGGFGLVYKGELSLPSGPIMVAFKKLDRRPGQRKVDFWKKVMMLSKYKHENLISLMNYCKKGDEMILVFDYASRGSLDRYLSDASLTWTHRLKICVGAARGLNYLHDPSGEQQRVIHGDIKSGNILLDENWMAKVSDVGLINPGRANQEQNFLFSHTISTPGYRDPLYREIGFLSKESDVYSFGVVLFEVLCGRLCFECNNKGELNNILVPKWRQCYEKKTLDGIIFFGLKEQMDPSSLNAFSAIAYRCVKGDRKKRPIMAEVVKELEFALQVSKDYDQLKIQMKDILSATNNFDSAKLIGRGGYGLVYKGELSLPSGPIMVAFKKLDLRPGEGKVDFWKKVMMLSKYKHENLISLMNYCNKGDEMILGFDYASRGSLDRYLSDASLTWTHRLKICVGAARGLNYLHDPSGSQKTVIHGDIKSGNILLDENWMAKVSDVGLLKVVPTNQAQKVLVSHAIGTPGYRDPFYQEIGFFSKESDVYSFGVVLFEILCGRLCCEYNNGVVTNIFVHKWRRYYEEKTIDEIIFPCLKEQMDPGSLNAFSAIAYQCVKKDREERPIMAEVVKELEFALQIQDVFEDFRKRVDFETLIKIANGAVTPLSYVLESHLYTHFMNGILVDDGKMWIAINMNGEIIEAVSAIKCITRSSYLSRGGGQKSRFPYVLSGVITDDVLIEVKTQFLSPNVTYTINLVIKVYFTSPKIINLPTFIPFKYKLENEKEYWVSSLGKYIREDGWLIFELYQFTSYQNEHNFKIQFTHSDIHSYDKYYIEGIEFRPVEQVRFKNHEDNNKVDALTTLPDSEIDWEEKLPTDYMELIKLSKDDLQHTTKRELYFLFRKGFLVNNDATVYDGMGNDGMWIATNMNGEIIEVVSAITCITADRLQQTAVKNSRFPYILTGEIFNDFVVDVKTHFLSPNVTYTINLVVKIWPYTTSRFLPFKYKLEDETYYWALSKGDKIKDDDRWLIFELYQFTSYQNQHNFKIQFFRSTNSVFDVRNTCYFEGIEFRPVEQVRFKNHEDNNKVDTLTTLPDSEINWEEKLPTELIKLSKDDQLQHTTKRELYFLFRKGFLVDNDATGNDRMWLSMNKSMKTRFMIPATSFLQEEQWVWKRLLESRFKQVATSSVHKYRLGFRIACKIISQLLSYQRNYSCHLIYKWSESDSRHVGLLLNGDCSESSRDITLYTTHHTPFIGPKDEKSFQRSYDACTVKGHPKQRKDGWMEFQLCEVSSKANGDIILNFPVTCYLNNYHYLDIVVEGLEFRPL